MNKKLLRFFHAIGMTNLTDKEVKTYCAQNSLKQDPNTCPNCGHNKFYDGPEGGCSQDILCCKCGTEYCYSPFGFQLLSRDEGRAAIYGLDKLPSTEGVLPILDQKKVGFLGKIGL